MRHLEQPGAWDGTWILQWPHCGSGWSLSLGNDSRWQLEVLKSKGQLWFWYVARRAGAQDRALILAKN